MGIYRYFPTYGNRICPSKTRIETHNVFQKAICMDFWPLLYYPLPVCRTSKQWIDGIIFLMCVRTAFLRVHKSCKKQLQTTGVETGSFHQLLWRHPTLWKIHNSMQFICRDTYIRIFFYSLYFNYLPIKTA